MPSFKPDTIDVTGLAQLVKALKKKPPKARIGIIGVKNTRKADDEEKNPPSNSEIGAAHEYGSPKHNLPQRSFLRVPLIDHLNEEINKSGVLTDKEVKAVIKAGSLVPWMRSIAVIAEAIVKKAFDTGGYGKWPGWKGKYYTNRTGNILVDTTQLRDSITSEVKDNDS